MKRLTEARTVCINLCFLAFILPASTGFAFVKPSCSVMPTTFSSPVCFGRVDSPTLTKNAKYPSHCKATSSTTLSMTTSNGDSSKLPFLLDPGTRGGAVFLSFVLFLLPLIAYAVVTNVFGYDEVEAGKWIGVGFTAAVSFLWVGTYIFRVANKDMTYVSVMLFMVVVLLNYTLREFLFLR
jgi:hypothetical protein